MEHEFGETGNSRVTDEARGGEGRGGKRCECRDVDKGGERIVKGR